MMPILTCILGAALGAVGTDQVNRAKEKRSLEIQTCLEQRLKERESLQVRRKALQAKIQFYVQLKNHLDGSYSGFKNQIFARNRLYASLERNHAPLPKLIEAHPQYKNGIPELNVLQDHLDLWLSKYRARLAGSDDVCLVYVGVADNKPFPSSIDEQTARMLEDTQKQVSELQSPAVTCSYV